MRWLLLLLWLPFAAHADDEVTICYNYGCSTKATVAFDVNDLERIAGLFDDVDTPVSERSSIQLAIGLMEQIAGQQTPTRNDKGGNVNDDGVDGRMDCIDHSHNTTAYLKLIERHGWLQFHRVLAPVERAPWLLDVHWGAEIEDTTDNKRYVVDSWFFDNGHPAAIFPLAAWMKGAAPHE
jgi:hypothetical protein